MNKDLRKVLRALEHQGFTLTTLNSGHIEVRKEGQRVTTFAGTASDHRSMRNSIAYARRAGFVWPPKR